MKTKTAVMYTYTVPSPLGTVFLASDGQSLTGLWVEDQKYYAPGLGAGTVEKQLPVFKQAEQWLQEYFEGKNPEINIPLAPAGSVFRQRVFEIMRTIPYGQLMTYGEIARRVAHDTGKQRMSAQAVGGAVGHNPISIMIPCHRVVGTNGSLTGYAGGINKKIYLLNLEKAPVENYFVPKHGTAL